MQGAGRWIYVVQLEVPAALEPTFTRLYDEEHVPALLAVPGVHSCFRYELLWADTDSMPRWLTIYEVDDPEVPRSLAWREASATGDWPTLVRPNLTVRTHGMFRKIERSGSTAAIDEVIFRGL